MKLRLTLALAALSLAGASPAAAQFTTVVAPPKKVVEAQAAREAQVAAAAAARDTGHRATLQAMSAWVDSVAGAPAPGTVTVDSANGAIATDSATVTADRPATTKFKDGAPAPDTASPLPLVLVAGMGAMLIGAALLFTSRRAALVEARRRRDS